MSIRLLQVLIVPVAILLNSWLVSNITGIHQTSRFPLLGAHRTADCSDCHKSETLVRFDVPGVNCIDCHREDYMSTTNPNHAEAGFSEDCSSCHPVNSFEWTGAGFNHDFFPLTQGHSGLNCSACHTTGNYPDANPDCFSCHQTDYNNTTNPNHQSMGFPTTCTTCHTTKPRMETGIIQRHDNQSFPIYSGKHSGTWDSCTDCHTNPSDYSQFTCLTCHEHNKTSMDNEHDEVEWLFIQQYRMFTLPSEGKCRIKFNYETISSYSMFFYFPG